MTEHQVVEQMPVIVDHDDDEIEPDRSSLPIGADIVGGVAGMIFLIVLAWLLLTMAGVLG